MAYILPGPLMVGVVAEVLDVALDMDVAQVTEEALDMEETLDMEGESDLAHLQGLAPQEDVVEVSNINFSIVA